MFEKKKTHYGGKSLRDTMIGCKFFPLEAVKTNAIWTENVLNAAPM